MRRRPKNYDGVEVTTRRVSDLLEGLICCIEHRQEERPDLILAAWPDIIGPQLASMTQAFSFHEGILTVKVNNSTLYSLLSQHDRPKVLANLRRRFPQVSIKNVVFRMG